MRMTLSQPEAQGKTALQEAGAQGSPHPHLNHVLPQPRVNKLTLHFTCLVLNETDFAIWTGLVFTIEKLHVSFELSRFRLCSQWREKYFHSSSSYFKMA